MGWNALFHRARNFTSIARGPHPNCGWREPELATVKSQLHSMRWIIRCKWELTRQTKLEAAHWNGRRHQGLRQRRSAGCTILARDKCKWYQTDTCEMLKFSTEAWNARLTYVHRIERVEIPWNTIKSKRKKEKLINRGINWMQEA